MADRRRITRRAATLTLLTGALSGCSLLGSGSEDGSGSADAAGQGASDAGGEAADSGGSSAPKPGVDAVDTGDVIASQEVSVAGSEDRTATIGVVSLTVEGDVQTLRLMVTPHFASADDDDQISLYDVWNERPFEPRLVDKEHLKVYSPISTTFETWASDSVYTQTLNETPIEAWAIYAAPEDDIESIDIRLADAWPVFTDVPITR